MTTKPSIYKLHQRNFAKIILNIVFNGNQLINYSNSMFYDLKKINKQ